MPFQKDCGKLVGEQLREAIRATVVATINPTDDNVKDMQECEVNFIDALHDYVDYRIEQHGK